VIDTVQIERRRMETAANGPFIIASNLCLFVISFAYRHGVERDADPIFRVRFLDRPPYVPNFSS
jgi:UPF0042 nucleotide-binding protein